MARTIEFSIGNLRSSIFHCRSRRRGFTLVEMLVVIAIIGVLVGLLLPAVNMAREAGRRATCANNIKQIVAAILNYEGVNQQFPPGRVGCDAYSGSPCNGVQGAQTPGTSGFLLILPQLDDNARYNNLTPLSNGAVYPAVSDSTSNSWATTVTSASNTMTFGLAAARPKVFTCPSDHAQPTTNTLLTPVTTTCSYAMVLGTSTTGAIVPGTTPTASNPLPLNNEQYQKYYNNGAFIYLTPRRAGDVRDGLSSTFFIGEAASGDSAASLNCWPLAIAYLSSLRSTYNPLNTPAGAGVMISVTHHGQSGLSSSTPTANGAFFSQHPQGANFGYGGGNVQFTSMAIDYATYEALSTIAGGEAIPAGY
jgi:prepilin-type N-terminal cleavage/methylation domain-containing protein